MFGKNHEVYRALASWERIILSFPFEATQSPLVAIEEACGSLRDLVVECSRETAGTRLVMRPRRIRRNGVDYASQPMSQGIAM